MQVTNKWSSVDSSAFLFTRMSNTYSHVSDAIIVKFATGFLDECVLVRCALMDTCLNMMFGTNKAQLAQKSNDRPLLRFRSHPTKLQCHYQHGHCSPLAEKNRCHFIFYEPSFISQCQKTKAPATHSTMHLPHNGPSCK